MSINEGLTTACFFPTTRWGDVAAAAGGEAPDPGRAMGELLARYIPALRTFLMLDQRLDRHRADDLLQSFVAERVLERNLLARADPSRGRFRTFLLACLSNHVAMERRREAAAKRNPGAGRLLPLDDHAADAMAGEPRSDVFDVAWGRQVIAEALQRMRRECESSLRADLWALFHGRVVAPAMEGAAPLDYAEITARFRFATPAEATNALVTAKRMFLRMLRSVVAEYADGDEVDEELVRLKRILAGAGPDAGLHK